MINKSVESKIKKVLKTNYKSIYSIIDLYFHTVQSEEIGNEILHIVKIPMYFDSFKETILLRFEELLKKGEIESLKFGTKILLKLNNEPTFIEDRENFLIEVDNKIIIDVCLNSYIEKEEIENLEGGINAIKITLIYTPEISLRNTLLNSYK